MHEGVARLSGGVDIAYESFGDRDGRPLLLIMGLGGPGLWWDVALCERLAGRGFHVVRYDNRDIGRSTHLRDHHVTRRQLIQAFVGRRPVAPYLMQDLADDAFGLLDHLELKQAHVVGVSMGGMIAQTMAISDSVRVQSLVSIMSTTGRRSVGWQDPRLFPLLLGPAAVTRERYLDRSRKVWSAIASPDFPIDDAVRHARAGDTWDRGVRPAGVARQMLAVVTQPDRTADLGRLQIPVTVIHGTADKMVHPSGGRATAAATPGSELIMIKGMGHDLPPELHGIFADAIERTADRADSQSTRPSSSSNASRR